VEGFQLETTQQVVDLFCSHLKTHPKTSYSGDQSPVMRTFWHFNLVDVDKVIEYNINSIKGTRDVHSVRFVGLMDVNKLLRKTLACFCCFCVDSNFLTCENFAWTKH
jgi:hypothetical protein